MICPISQVQKDQNPLRSHRWTLNFTTKFPSTGRTAATALTVLSLRPRHHQITSSGKSTSLWSLRTFLLPRQTATSCPLLDLRPTIYHRYNKLHPTHIPVHIPSHRVSPPSLPLRSSLSFLRALHGKSPSRLPTTRIKRHHRALPEARFRSVSVRVNPTPLLHLFIPRPRQKAIAFPYPPVPPSLPSSTPQRSSNPQMLTNPEKADELLKSFINPVSSTVWDLSILLLSTKIAATPAPFPRDGNRSS